MSDDGLIGVCLDIGINTGIVVADFDSPWTIPGLVHSETLTLANLHPIIQAQKAQFFILELPKLDTKIPLQPELAASASRWLEWANQTGKPVYHVKPGQWKTDSSVLKVRHLPKELKTVHERDAYKIAIYWLNRRLRHP